MKVFILLKGGSSSIEGEVEQKNEGELYTFLNGDAKFLIVRNVPYAIGDVMVSKSAIAYVKRK